MFLATLEGRQNILIPTVMAQRQSNPVIDKFGVPGHRVIVPEQIGVWRNPQPALTQHHKAAQHNKGIGVEMNQ
jgi:hypothetical protein